MKINIIRLLLLALMLFSFGCGVSKDDINPGSSFQSWSKREYKHKTGQVTLRLRLSDQSPSLVDNLRLVVELESKSGVLVSPFYLPENKYAPLVLLEDPLVSERILDNGRLQTRYQYVFELLKTGEYFIQPFFLYFRLLDEKKDDLKNWQIYSLKTSRITLQVKPVDLTEGTQIKTIEGLMFPGFNWLPVIVGLLILVGIYWLLGYFYLKRKPPLLQVAAEDTGLDYFQQAIKQLEELSQEQLIEKGDFNRLHTGLSLILREFIEARYHLKAREQTTEEFILDLPALGIFDIRQKALLKGFFQLADLVKFAGFEPESQTSQDALSSIRDFIYHSEEKHGV